MQILADLRVDPADTLFQVLDDAGVPLVADLFDLLPSVLENRIKGWINDLFFSHVFGNQPVTDALDELLATAQTVLTRFDVTSVLESLPGGSQ